MGPAPVDSGRRFAVGLGELSGAVADLGVFVPLAASLILVNGIDPGAVLLFAGLLVVGSGLAFGVPFPVQPLKALTAVAAASGLGPGIVHAAGLEIGALLLLLSLGRVADAVARLFTRTVVRALQVGVGILLVLAAVRLVREPPPVFRGTPPSPWPVLLAAAAFAAVALAARHRRYGFALALFAAGVGGVVASAGPALSGPDLRLPDVSVPRASDFVAALLLLVVPQLPLTFGNAVVAVSDLSREYFGTVRSKVTPSRVCVSAGLGNVLSALGGGMPMCHGAGGLTAHHRLGARTAGMNLVLGGAFVAAGLLFAGDVTKLLGLLPVWVLAAFLAYAGARHALLARDLDGFALAVALGAGVAGAALGNLSVTAGTALALDHGRRVLRRRRRGEETVAAG